MAIDSGMGYTFVAFHKIDVNLFKLKLNAVIDDTNKLME